MFPKIIRIAWPIMLSYIAVGLACGVLSAQAGMAWWMVALISLTYFSGSGQFMMANLWLSGMPVFSIALSVAAISLRFALYSASLAPRLEGASKLETLGASATLIEEGYGISLGKFAEGDGWGPRETIALNVVLILTWVLFSAIGAVVGSVLSIPTAVAGFVCTSLFIYLLASQRATWGNVVAALVAFASVAVLKYAGLSGIAVFAATILGVLAALVMSEALLVKGEEAHDAR